MPLRNPAKMDLEDLTVRERIVFAPMVALVIIMGIFPQWFLSKMSPAVNQTLSAVRRTAGLSPIAAAVTIPGGQPAAGAARAVAIPTEPDPRTLRAMPLDQLNRRLQDGARPPGLPNVPLVRPGGAAPAGQPAQPAH